ncbi:MAG TPA: amidinotransferase [Pseudonocardia sp.]|nr:amidinotransferase [Pseudonocardia sp.]
MCRPSHFDVRYSINPWMDPTKPVAKELALAQWEQLHDVFVGLGHRVDLIDPVPGLPDMVFAANGATVVDGAALVARFRHEQRAPEAQRYLDWFRANGFGTAVQSRWTNEGEGDYLVTGRTLLAGSGFRTDRRAHVEVYELFGRPTVALDLVDPRFYHLDTALAVLGEDEIMYYPPAFSDESRRLLRELYPDAIVAADADAAVLGLNAVSDGLHVVLPDSATTLADQLRKRGYEPIGVDLSELLKAGGGVKCCTLEIRPAPAADDTRRAS